LISLDWLASFLVATCSGKVAPLLSRRLSSCLEKGGEKNDVSLYNSSPFFRRDGHDLEDSSIIILISFFFRSPFAIVGDLSSHRRFKNGKRKGNWAFFSLERVPLIHFLLAILNGPLFCFWFLGGLCFLGRRWTCN
jgi:hypothetical protein